MIYRLLRVETDGQISGVLIVNASDHPTALARAKDFADDRAVEVWCGSCQIAALGQVPDRISVLQFRR